MARSDSSTMAPDVTSITELPGWPSLSNANQLWTRIPPWYAARRTGRQRVGQLHASLTERTRNAADHAEEGPVRGGGCGRLGDGALGRPDDRQRIDMYTHTLEPLELLERAGGVGVGRCQRRGLAGCSRSRQPYGRRAASRLPVGSWIARRDEFLTRPETVTACRRRAATAQRS